MKRLILTCCVLLSLTSSACSKKEAPVIDDGSMIFNGQKIERVIQVNPGEESTVYVRSKGVFSFSANLKDVTMEELETLGGNCLEEFNCIKISTVEVMRAGETTINAATVGSSFGGGFPAIEPTSEKSGFIVSHGLNKSYPVVVTVEPANKGGFK